MERRLYEVSKMSNYRPRSSRESQGTAKPQGSHVSENLGLRTVVLSTVQDQAVILANAYLKVAELKVPLRPVTLAGAICYLLLLAAAKIYCCQKTRISIITKCWSHWWLKLSAISILSEHLEPGEIELSGLGIVSVCLSAPGSVILHNLLFILIISIYRSKENIIRWLCDCLV